MKPKFHSPYTETIKDFLSHKTQSFTPHVQVPKYVFFRENPMGCFWWTLFPTPGKSRNPECVNEEGESSEGWGRRGSLYRRMCHSPGSSRGSEGIAVEESAAHREFGGALLRRKSKRLPCLWTMIETNWTTFLNLQRQLHLGMYVHRPNGQSYDHPLWHMTIPTD